MAELAVLGGTFNPPHIGHLVMVHQAMDQLRLDRIALMPVSRPPHKEVADDPGADVRLALCRLAAGDDERLEVSALEIERGGASFTVDTLRALHDREPEHELTFIVGGDMALSFPSWRDPEAILKLARLAVAERQELRREDISRRLAPLHDGSRVEFFEMPRIDVSSSDIRGRVAAGRTIRHLVPDAVEQEIVKRDLYRQAAGRPAA